jgi:hypothetical protein
MYHNYRYSISLFFFLVCGLFSANSFASTVIYACTYAKSNNSLYGMNSTANCSSVLASGGYNPTYVYCVDNSRDSSVAASCSTPGNPANAYGTAPPACPAAGTTYSGGYVPATTAPTATVPVLNPNDSTYSYYCDVTIDPNKSTCPPNTYMPTFGTSTTLTKACIITGTYTGSASAAGSSSTSATAPPGTAGETCPTGTGSYSISNGTSTIKGCATSTNSTTSNSSATPATTTTTGSSTTNTTNTTTNAKTTTNADGSTTTTSTTTQTNPSACGGAGQPACNVNSTCGGAGQPACNNNIGDSTFTLFTPVTSTPIFTDKTQGNVPTSGFSVSNYSSAGSSACPVTDQTGSVFGQSFTLPFSQICIYLDFVRYIVIVAAAIAAMKLL